MSVLDKSVSKNEAGYWDFACPGIQGSLCGDPVTGVPFTSKGWPTKENAKARGQEHFDEHLGKSVTSTLEDFRAKHGIGVHDDGTAYTLDDLKV